jgi:hypothetical protein
VSYLCENVPAMKRATRLRRADAFESVRIVGLTFPEVESAIRYDGSPILKAAGCFMAGLASHPSAEPGTLVVRMDFNDRDGLLEDAPETYYVTDYYERHPVVLARLARLHEDALRDLLTMSWRLTVAKARPRRHLRRP